MFSAVPMKLMQAVVLAQDERAVLKDLGRLGAVHLRREKTGPDTVSLAPADRAGELAQCDRILARIGEIRQSLGLPVPKSRPGAPAAAMKLDQAEAHLSAMERQAGDILLHRQDLINRQKELTSLCESVSPYRGLDIPLDGLDRFSFLHFVTGSLPQENLDDLVKDLGNNVAFLPVSQQKGRQAFLAVTTLDGQSDLERALQQAGFQREQLPLAEGETVDGLSRKSEEELKGLSMELEQLNDRVRAMAAGFEQSLAEIEGFVDTERRLLDASLKFSRTDSTVMITGWVPASDVVILEQAVGTITNGRYMLKTTFPVDVTEDEVPVMLRHPRLLRPFEMLVTAYGLPSYRELEPTLFVALSYILMFGLMFGDVGHGMVLAACGLIVRAKSRSDKVRDMGLLLLFGGASSIIFGMVYGSYFGIEAFKHYALWHDPLEGDPMGLMYGAMGIGIALISLGLILNIINRFRRGDVIGGILDKFGLVGLLFYWGTLVILVNGAAIRSRGLMGLAIILFLAVPIIGWSLKEPLEHVLHRGSAGHHEAAGGLGTAIMESCIGAFEAILSYLANTISFVRLAAYAMSHAALLFAAFMVAEEVRHIPVGGSVFSIVVIVLGNIVAIVLEGVIASVQALRLEFYEFFGKFFSGSGQPFEPFSLASDENHRAP